MKLLQLDNRYFRTPQEEALEGGDILGEQQWQWLESELSHSDAQLHIIVSGTQVLPDDKLIREKWRNYPKSYQRLFDTLKRTKPPGVILVSGDIHNGEILRKDCSGLGYPLYELTSSGLTHSCTNELGSLLCRILLNTAWNSELRQGDYYDGLNFGTIEINWETKPVSVALQIRDVNGTVVIQRELVAGIPSESTCNPFRDVPSWMLQPKKVLIKRFGKLLLLPLVVMGLLLLWLLKIRKSTSKRKKS